MGRHAVGRRSQGLVGGLGPTGKRLVGGCPMVPNTTDLLAPWQCLGVAFTRGRDDRLRARVQRWLPR
eukprot:8810327-Lingulodinium_polyedra.AAC.1